MFLTEFSRRNNWEEYHSRTTRLTIHS